MVDVSEGNKVIADAIVRSLVAKIKAMEALDRGLLSDTSVTSLDRVAVILGSLNPKYYSKLLSTEPGDEDIAAVLGLVKDTGMWDEEVVLLAKVRRVVLEALKRGISKVVDVVNVPEEGVRSRREAITI